MQYRLTPEAEDDLVGIWHYTLGRWGADQSGKYLGELEVAFDRLAQGLIASSPCSALVPDYESEVRFARHKSHYIFFRQAGDRIEVLTLIHTASQEIIEDFLRGSS